MGDVIFVARRLASLRSRHPAVDPGVVLTPEGVKNLKPEPGEPAFMPDTQSRGCRVRRDIEETHALISNLPGLYGNGSILYLEANQIASVMGAVQALIPTAISTASVARLKLRPGS